MSPDPAQTAPDRPGKTVLARLSRDRHFLIAAAVLAAAAAGWGGTIRLLQWVTDKQPVPWPPAVRVDPDTRRMLALPDTFGPFVLYDDKDTEAVEGEIVFDDADLAMLGIKTGYDSAARVSARRSNWYVARIYADGRRGGRPRLWRVSVYYYTGGLDKVPHIPERCEVADGAQWLDSEVVRFRSEHTAGPWAGPVRFRRARFARQGRTSVQYYTFSLNGRPETSWETVRASLSLSPWMRHCYFAKIQFAPYGDVADVEQTDRAAEEFAALLLPHVLAVLPTTRDVRRLAEKH